MKVFLEVKDVTGEIYQQDLGNITEEIAGAIETSVKAWKSTENGLVEIPDNAGNIVLLNTENVVYVKVTKIPTSEPVNPGFTA